MKVLQINSVCETGSTGKIAAQISDHLNNHRIENYIAYGLGNSDRSNTFKIGCMLDAHLHSFLSRQFCIQGYGSYFTTLRLLRYIDSIQPTVIHLHNIHGHYLHFPLLFRYLNKRDIPVVWTFHDCWPFTGKCAHYLSVNCDKWKTACDNCPQLHTYPDSRTDRSAPNYRAKKHFFSGCKNLNIVTVSRWLQSQVEQSFLSSKPIHTIYNGINTEVFSDQETQWRTENKLENKFMILGVSSIWSNHKGLDAFVKLAEQLDDHCVIVLVGLTEAQKNSIPSNILGIPATKNQMELAAIYRAADVFVHLSTEETFGLVIAEAMACGTPAIVYNSSACPEILDEGCGFVVPAGDIDAVVDGISKIQETSKNSYRKRVREHVVQHFSQEAMLEGYLNLYHMIAGGGENIEVSKPKR